MKLWARTAKATLRANLSGRRTLRAPEPGVRPYWLLPPLIGAVDGVDAAKLVGWAACLDRPAQPLELEVCLDGRSLGGVRADLERRDLIPVLGANLRHGFRFVLPSAALLDGGLIEVFTRPHGQLVGVHSLTADGGRVRRLQRLPRPAFSRGSTRGDAEAEAEIGVGQARFAVEQALDLSMRLVELERLERKATRERDFFKAELDALRRLVDDELEGGPAHDGLPAVRLSRVVEGLSLPQRRELWVNAVSERALPDVLFGYYPHGGEPGRLRILLLGSGGLGDVLYLTPLIRGLYEAFERPEIVVAHHNRACTAVLAQNPYVHHALHTPADVQHNLSQTAHGLDVFDLVADVRYAMTYSTPPLSRVDPGFLLQAHGRAAEWQPFVRREWPHFNNALARRCVARGMSQLDLLGYTANVAVGNDSPLEYHFADPRPLKELEPLFGRPYVTVHHGADRNMVGRGGVQTKNLPLETWAEVVAGLARAGFATVQLGERGEAAIPGVEVDLRGRTALPQTAWVLSRAAVHVDTEGGLVHLARAVSTRSVVCFGPTSLPFFAYRANVNLAPSSCGDCWWTVPDWAARCPRGQAAPECMPHPTAAVVSAAVAVVREAGAGPVLHVAPETGTTSLAGLGALIAGSPEAAADLLERATAMGGEPERLFVLPADFDAACSRWGERLQVRVFSLGGAAAEGRCDWALAAGIDTGDALGLAALLRVWRALGEPEVFLNLQPHADPAAACVQLSAAAAGLPGAALSVSAEPGLRVRPVDDVPVFLRVVRPAAAPDEDPVRAAQ